MAERKRKSGAIEMIGVGYRPLLIIRKLPALGISFLQLESGQGTAGCPSRELNAVVTGSAPGCVVAGPGITTKESDP